MPIQNGKYINPGWVDNAPPTIDSAELNAISDTLEKLDAGGGAGGGGGKRYARFVIGTSTAGWTAADCDYLCDGTADQEEINAAISALPSNGGEIKILDGTYNLSGNISYPSRGTSAQRFYVLLHGSGQSTSLNFLSSARLNVSSYQDIEIENAYMDGVIISPPGDAQVSIRDCYLYDPQISIALCNTKITRNSFTFSSNSQNVPISIIAGRTNQGDLYNAIFANNTIRIEENASFSIVANVSDTLVSGNIVLSNGNISVGITASGGSVVTGNILYNCTLGSTLASARYSGNYVYNGNLSCLSSPCTGNTVLNGSIYASEGSSVTGNTVVQESPSGEACIVIGKSRNNNDENALSVISSNSCEGGTIGILLNTNRYNNRSESHATVIGNACSSSVPLQIESVWSDCLITGNMFPNGAIVDNGTNNTKANNFTGT